jgi:hypothetical protein
MVVNHEGFIRILDDSLCNDIVKRIDSLRDFWKTVKPYPPMWTLGATSYIDAKNGINIYHKIKLLENKILIENFSDVYEKIINRLSEYIGDVELEKDLALPGFHIIGDKKTISNYQKFKVPINYLDAIHKDDLYKVHMNMLSNKYRLVESEKIISITLSIKLPEHGSGLCIWDKSLIKFSEDRDFEKQVLESGLYKDYELGNPIVIKYKEGSAFCFSGKSFHQIAPVTKAHPGDRRITMQAHGIVCDGVWRLFF